MACTWRKHFMLGLFLLGTMKSNSPVQAFPLYMPKSKKTCSFSQESSYIQLLSLLVKVMNKMLELIGGWKLNYNTATAGTSRNNEGKWYINTGRKLILRARGAHMWQPLSNWCSVLLGHDLLCICFSSPVWHHSHAGGQLFIINMQKLIIYYAVYDTIGWQRESIFYLSRRI